MHETDAVIQTSPQELLLVMDALDISIGALFDSGLGYADQPAVKITFQQFLRSFSRLPTFTKTKNDSS